MIKSFIVDRFQSNNQSDVKQIKISYMSVLKDTLPLFIVDHVSNDDCYMVKKSSQHNYTHLFMLGDAPFFRCLICRGY